MSDVLVMLPGAFFRPGDYAAHGFIEALQRRYKAFSAVQLDVPAELYLEGDVAPWLHERIMGLSPKGTSKEGRTWLLGISLGGLGALHYAKAHPGQVAGIVLLAPFLGSRGLVREVTVAGGLSQWEPGEIGALDFERRLMRGLKAGLPSRLHVGFGTSDRFAPGGRVLAQALPQACTEVIDGDHDWPTWMRLWSAILAKAPFDEV